MLRQPSPRSSPVEENFSYAEEFRTLDVEALKRDVVTVISWADLILFAGNCAFEAMGFTTLGFGFGPDDIWEPEETWWGPEDTWLGDNRHSGDGVLAGPFGATQMGLIYVNPEGPGGTRIRSPPPGRSGKPSTAWR